MQVDLNHLGCCILDLHKYFLCVLIEWSKRVATVIEGSGLLPLHINNSGLHFARVCEGGVGVIKRRQITHDTVPVTASDVAEFVCILAAIR